MGVLANIVVGVDGRECGWEGLELAQRLSRLSGAELTVVCAYPSPSFEHAPLIWNQMTDRASASRVLDEAAAHVAEPDACDYVARSGSTPAVCLQDVAAERDADLLVLGGAQHGAIGRALGGSVLAAALVDPPCPVAVSPRGSAGGLRHLRRIGVAVDGSPEAFAAIRWAHAFADAHADIRELCLIGVDDAARAHGAAHGRGELLAGSGAGGPRAPRRDALDLRWTQLSGRVDRQLSDRSLHLDLLVIGTHGRGGLARMLHGSVSRDVAEHARCPVIAVPLLS